mmetsp:Transcript_24758/g.67611  ORF Transcript_24758/g.67611 Transcript_24758/m.67611 type:complete len:260 (+) Transcript_24758:737-1516(+)
MASPPERGTGAHWPCRRLRTRASSGRRITASARGHEEGTTRRTKMPRGTTTGTTGDEKASSGRGPAGDRSLPGDGGRRGATPRGAASRRDRGGTSHGLPWSTSMSSPCLGDRRLNQQQLTVRCLSILYLTKRCSTHASMRLGFLKRSSSCRVRATAGTSGSRTMLQHCVALKQASARGRSRSGPSPHSAREEPRTGQSAPTPTASSRDWWGLAGKQSVSCSRSAVRIGCTSVARTWATLTRSSPVLSEYISLLRATRRH